MITNIPEKVNNVYQVFKDYFKEENVDLDYVPQNYAIIIYWKELTITNEFNDSVNIQGLYCKIKINKDGKLISDRPSFIRDSYTEYQFKSGYIHSHIPRMYDDNSYKLWQGSCLGTGPILNTIDKLKEDPNAYNDYMTWTLFCFELDKYVRVESVAGVPYYKMKTIAPVTTKTKPIEMSYVTSQSFYLRGGVVKNTRKQIIDNFVWYLLNNNVIKFTYANGNYTIGMSNKDLILNVSNAFLKWLEGYGQLHKIPSAIKESWIYDVKCINNKLYVIVNTSRCILNAKEFDNKPLNFYFKGKLVKLHITNIINTDESKNSDVKILNTKIIGSIIFKILYFINCNYGNKAN